MLKLTNKQQGFTIVELLIVIVVIGILAAITIVAYNNVNDKARASSAVSALDQAKKKLELYKAENGGYPADLNTIGILDSPSVAYEYTNSANTGYCLTATVSNISYYLNNSTKTSPAEGGCSDHTWPGGVAMTNLVTNGDFSQGTSGWLTAASGPPLVVDGVISFTPVSSAVSGSGQQHLYQTVQLSTGSKYYLRADIYGKARIALTTYNFPANTSHVWASYSAIQQSTVTGARAVGVRSTQTSLWEEIRADNLTLINLTTAFGAGNEPTKDQMDQIMEQFPNNWFNGTVTANTKGIL